LPFQNFPEFCTDWSGRVLSEKYFIVLKSAAQKAIHFLEFHNFSY